LTSIENAVLQLHHTSIPRAPNCNRYLERCCLPVGLVGPWWPHPLIQSKVQASSFALRATQDGHSQGERAACTSGDLEKRRSVPHSTPRQPLSIGKGMAVRVGTCTATRGPSRLPAGDAPEPRKRAAAHAQYVVPSAGWERDARPMRPLISFSAPAIVLEAVQPDR
jgi:hypothetical protein